MGLTFVYVVYSLCMLYPAWLLAVTITYLCDATVCVCVLCLSWVVVGSGCWVDGLGW